MKLLKAKGRGDAAWHTYIRSVPLPARGRQLAASMGRPRINEHHLH